MEMALVAMEGEALIWYEWREAQVPCPTWREFKKDLVKRFQPGVVRSSMEPLLSVKQTTSVRQYRKEFEAVANASKDLNWEVVMGIFLHGLRLKLQVELKVSHFWSLAILMDKALELEEQNMAWRVGGVGAFHKGGGSSKGLMSTSVPVTFRTGEAAFGSLRGERRSKCWRLGRS